MRHAVITRHRGEFQVRRMCRVLEVAPSGYQASLKRPPSWADASFRPREPVRVG